MIKPWTMIILMLGVASCASTTHTVVIEEEVTPLDYCDYPSGVYPDLCHGKFKMITHRMNISEQIVLIQPPATFKNPTTEFVNGYRAGWKEQADNHYFVVCPKHREIHRLYTPKASINDDKSTDYREGWGLGWKKAKLDADEFLEKLTKKVKAKGEHNKTGHESL